nr:RHS repeat-associated core domain-containing protein [Thiohalomonas denitrificans]
METGKMLACGTGGDGYSTKSVNPIDFAIGNKFFSDTDYRGTGSFPIVFTRTYNSLNLGWRLDYTQRIESLEPGKVAVRRPGGQSYEFTLSSGSWTPDPDVVERLEWQAEANGGAGSWRYSLADNTREFFDANGRLIAIRNPAGQEQTISYGADGKEMTISGPDGDLLIVALNDSGLLPQHIIDKTGRTTSYEFEGLYLRRVDYPHGTNKQYLYEVPERPWLITGIIDENGNRSHTVAYDTQGRAVMSELAGGAERVEVSYNEDGTTTLTNALGKRTTFHFETLHGVRKIVHVEGEPTATCQGTAMDYRFDDNGFLIEKTDAEGVTTRFSRDVYGLELARTEAAGLSEERTIATEWDTSLRKPLVVTEGNTETRYTYDGEGRTLSRTVTDLTSGASRTSGYTYNSQGLLESVDGPREDAADITTYSYDASGRLSRVTNALGHVTETVSRDNYGRPTLTRDANGLQTLLTYDENGRLITSQVGSETTTMAYDAVGNLTGVTAPGGVALHYRYDAANRLIGLSDTVGNHIDYTLDAMGNRTSEKVYDADGRLARSQQKVYDELSRLLRSIGADGQTAHYGYDRNDNLIDTFDPLGRLHANSFDALNRLIEQTDPLGGVTRYGYDAQDRLTTVTDPNGNATTYLYDGLGDLIEQHSPDTGTTIYTHDAAGNVLSKTDAKGQITNYTYDALNRPTRVTHAAGTVDIYTYDTAPNGIGRLASLTDSSGRTAFEYDRHGRTTARHQSIQVEGAEHTLTTRYQYNSSGQLVGLTYPSGLEVDYGYANGQIVEVTVNGETLLSQADYEPFGPVSGWTWSNGQHAVRGYDLDGRLIRQSLGPDQRELSYDVVGNITAINGTVTDSVFAYDDLDRLASANDPDYNLSWEYDANGNRIYQTDSLTGNSTDYSIDTASNRLQAVGGTPYQHDANGNLLQDGSHNYQYNARDRLVSVDQGATGEYLYNALGQRVYKWAMLESGANPDLNGDGQITEADLHGLQDLIREGSNPVHADLNGDGQVDGRDTACIATLIGTDKGKGKGKDRDKSDNRPNGPEQTQGRHTCLPPALPQERLFAYDDWRLLGEYTPDGTPVQETVWFGDLPVATLQNGEIHYIHADHLGTPRVITQPDTGTGVWRWDSDPFGTAPANEDPDGDGRKLAYNLRFPGQYFDEETGLHYNYFRDYDSSTGRYIESDPIGLEGGLNTYVYAMSNPIVYMDIYSLKWVFIGWTTEKNEGLSWLWSNWANIYALCEKNECSGKERQEVLAYSWQTRPICIGEPACFDGGPGTADGAVNAALDLVESGGHAHKCGSMTGYQCFISTATNQDGQKFCDRLPD